jgi:hypothetical protein
MNQRTKQEEIRQGLEVLIRKWQADSPDAGYGYESDIWIPELLKYLHDNDVVIRVVDLNKPLTHEEVQYLAKGGKLFLPLIGEDNGD